MVLPTWFRHLVRHLPYPWRLTLRRWWRGPGIFADRYRTSNNTRVTLYTDNAAHVPGYKPREPLAAHLGKRTMRVSLIAPTRNEVTSAAEWCKGIARQTRQPDEIVIADAGSEDGTLASLHAFAGQSRVPFRIIVEPGCNIARARNLAIAQAHHPVIVATDFGCHPAPDWLEKLVTPFEANPETQVVAGLYTPVNRRGETVWQGFPIHPNLRRINPANFLPSNRSIAFTRKAWQAVGGYPEWLTLTGEDTWFDRELQRHGGEWAFVPEAIVEWHAPENFVEYCRKVYQWTQGDGESGLHASFYWRYVWQLNVAFGGTLALIVLAALIIAQSVTPTALWIALIGVLWCIGVLTVSHLTGVPIPILFPEAILESVHLAGFLAGTRRRNAALKRRLASVRGMFFVLSGVPIDDTGGGARCTQLTLELLRQDFAVVFVHKFPKYESQELDLKIGHPNLFHYALAEFRWERFLREEGQWLKEKPLAAVIEFPLGEFLPLMRKIREHKGMVVYDLLDAWDTSLGGKWYARATEDEIIRASHVLIATAPPLVARLERQSGRPVAFLPNAVNTRLFDATLRYPRPADFPSAEWTLIYTGALWGQWFDWELLKQIGKAYPQAAVVVIGDYRGQCTDAPANVHFLGLKAQRDLPAYLAYSNVAIVPWRANTITDATSPLKVYEYLAMRLPVVAPAIAPLRDMPAVYLAQDASSFIAQVERARQETFPESSVERFINENTWEKRVDVLNNLVEQMCAKGTR